MEPIGPQDEVALPFVAFGLFWAAIVVWALRQTYAHTLGAMLQVLAKALSGPSIFGRRPFGFLGGALDSLNRKILSAMATAQGELNKGAAVVWNTLERLTIYQADTLYDLAWSVHKAVRGMSDVGIPRAVHAGTKEVRRGIDDVGKRLDQLERREERRLEVKTRALEREVAADFGLAKRGIDYVRGRIGERVTALEEKVAQEYAGIRSRLRVNTKRLERLEALLGAGLLTGAVLRVLSRVFPYYKCTNVRRFMRGVCRSPFGALDWLFTFTFEAMAVGELCTLIGLMSDAAATAEPLLLAFVDVEDVLIGCRGATKPLSANVRAQALPPAQGFASLPGL